MDFDNGQLNDSSLNYKKELYRLNCVEISSEIINPKYEEYPILFVDNIIKGNEKNEYENYVIGGRNGMPCWKDYYAIKNLVETLLEIDSLENKGAVKLLKQVEKSFIGQLYKKLDMSKDELSPQLKSFLFSVLQKLEFFYPDDVRIIKFLLEIDHGTVSANNINDAQMQYNSIFVDDHFFLKDEKLFIELCLIYFDSAKQKTFQTKLKKLKSIKLKKRVPELLEKTNQV